MFKPALAHGNVKPSNLLFDLHGNVRLVDMGLGAAEQGALGGAADALSPGSADAAGDGYAMGAVLLALLTGLTGDRASSDARARAIVERCDVGANEIDALADGCAQWPNEVAREVHAVAMALAHRGTDKRCTVSAARARLQMLAEAHLAVPLPDWVQGSASNDAATATCRRRHQRSLSPPAAASPPAARTPTFWESWQWQAIMIVVGNLVIFSPFWLFYLLHVHALFPGRGGWGAPEEGAAEAGGQTLGSFRNPYHPD